MSLRTQREGDTEVVAHLILTILRWALAPVTRDQLTDQVRDHMTLSLGYQWQRTTTERRVREAFKVLRRQGYPILSDGTGFKLATTDEQRHQAAEKMRKMARSLFVEADRLEAAPLPADPVQRSFEGGPGFEVRP